MDESEYLDPPPPYTPTPGDDESAMDTFLDRCMAANRMIDSNSNIEQVPDDEATMNVRNMLLFTLATDYSCNTDAELPATSRENFTTIFTLLNDLESARPTAAERQQFAPFFWTCLYSPCKKLQVPVELAFDGYVHTLTLVGHTKDAAPRSYETKDLRRNCGWTSTFSYLP